MFLFLVGRNLQWPSSVLSSEALVNFDQMQPTFGGLESSLIGWDSVPTSCKYSVRGRRGIHVLETDVEV